MASATTVIEISDSCIKVVAGNLSDGKPYVIFTTEIPLPGVVSRGEIIEYSKLIQTLNGFRNYHDETTGIQIKNLDRAVIILPPSGFDIFETTKITNVVSPTGIIEDLDIRNATSLVEKEVIPPGTEMVDTVPDCYILEGDRAFAYPPIGEKSNLITLKTKIHTLPSRVLGSYTDAFKNAGLRPVRRYVSVYAMTQFVKTIEDMPKNYILADLNVGYTSVSLIGNHTPFASSHFLMGLNDLVYRVSQEFSIPEIEANKILEVYGLDNRDLGFEPPIINSTDEFGRETKFYQHDLNKIINEFIDEYFVQFDTCLEMITNSYSDDVKNLPLILTSELLKVNGINDLFKKHFEHSEKVIFLSSNVVGARGPEYVSLLGALISCYTRKGSLTEERAKVSQLTRQAQK